MQRVDVSDELQFMRRDRIAQELRVDWAGRDGVDYDLARARDTWSMGPFEEAWMSPWGMIVDFLVAYDDMRIMRPPAIELLHRRGWGRRD